MTSGTLKMDIDVLEWFHTETGKTFIQLDMGFGCTMNFQVSERLEVPKRITFAAELELAK